VSFTYRLARHLRDGELVQQRVNLARRRQAKRHVTINLPTEEARLAPDLRCFGAFMFATTQLCWRRSARRGG
jgi:hypothetical protein